MFQIKNEAGRTTVYLYGTIGHDWDEESSNTAKNFAKTLDELSPKPLDIRIDSCGGDVYEGFAIASAIERYEGDTTVYVDGVAASAASYIALMADKVIMNDFSQIMIHDAWTLAVGNSSELIAMAARLESIDNTIAGIISARAGMEIEDVKAAMDAETWYTAEDAINCGLADEIIETKQRVAACIDRALLAGYKHVPAALTEEPEKSHDESKMHSDEGREPFVLGNKVYE